MGRFKDDVRRANSGALQPIIPLPGWDKYSRQLGYAVHSTNAARTSYKLATKKRR